MSGDTSGITPEHIASPSPKRGVGRPKADFDNSVQLELERRMRVGVAEPKRWPESEHLANWATENGIAAPESKTTRTKPNTRRRIYDRLCRRYPTAAGYDAAREYFGRLGQVGSSG